MAAPASGETVDYDNREAGAWHHYHVIDRRPMYLFGYELP